MPDLKLEAVEKFLKSVRRINSEIIANPKMGFGETSAKSDELIKLPIRLRKALGEQPSPDLIGRNSEYGFVLREVNKRFIRLLPGEQRKIDIKFATEAVTGVTTAREIKLRAGQAFEFGTEVGETIDNVIETIRSVSRAINTTIGRNPALFIFAVIFLIIGGLYLTKRLK